MDKGMIFKKRDYGRLLPIRGNNIFVPAPHRWRSGSALQLADRQRRIQQNQYVTKWL